MNDCTEARAAIQERIDGDLDAVGSLSLAGHLERCEACREYEDGIEQARRALRDLPHVPFPDDALAEVWAQTSGPPPGETATTSRSRWRAFAAVAASLAVLSVAVWLGVGNRAPQPTQPTDAEVAQAAEDARMVLALASGAIKRSEQAVIREVLTDRVSPTLQKIPIRWPGRHANDDGSNGA